jgi:hypothetical protein
MRSLEGMSGDLHAREEGRQRPRMARSHRRSSARGQAVGFGCSWRERFQDSVNFGSLRVDLE